ncbi:MAG: HNH endonuclease [Candidatus Heimdallarchaeota archaeon]|nr:HNH endonuclease [Candidatus Heimdallarchaeota archaeon]
MALLERQIQKLLNSEGVNLIFHKEIPSLYQLAQEIVINANDESGKEVVFIFGVDENHSITGIPGRQVDIKRQIDNFMGIFRPTIKYAIRSGFNPSDYTMIYYLHLYPNLRRLFYPHEIRKDVSGMLATTSLNDFSKDLQEIIDDANANNVIPLKTLINFFSPIHIAQFENYIDESVTQKLNRIIDTIQYFECRDDLLLAIETIQLEGIFSNNPGIFTLKCSKKIFQALDLQDELSKEIVINRMQHLFSLIPEGQIELESHINFFLRDIIVGDDTIFDFTIDTYEDLKNFLQVLSVIGITVNLDRVIKEIELGETVQTKIKSMKKSNGKIYNDELLSKIFIILMPYFEDTQSNVKSIFNEFGVQKNNRTKNKLKAQIEHRDRIIRPVKPNGRHERDTKLAVLLKEYYNYECQSCGSCKSQITQITVSHKIPLYFGVEYGGVDVSFNMEILCRFCHDAYEKKFEKEVFDNPAITSKQDLKSYLRVKFPRNFQF